MYPLFRPYMPKNLPLLKDILYSGALSYGQYGRQFEALLQKWIGCQKVIATNSFNSAFLVLLQTLNLKPGDEIIASPMTCLASTQPFATQNLKIRWADIDPSTGTLDPNSVRSKITSSTKAIFHNHFCGYVGYVDDIEEIAREYGVYLIDDSIEAFGSTFNGHKLGNLKSDATLFSFQTVRLPNTIDGGGIAFNNIDLAARATLIRDYGIERSHFRDSLNEINKECNIDIPGFGATPSELNSYLGIQQMSEIDQLLEKQRINFKKWWNYCQTEHINELSVINNSCPNGWIFGLLSNNKLETIRSWRAKGFYASGIHFPNNFYSVFQNQEKLLGVCEFYSRFVALPCGWWIEL